MRMTMVVNTERVEIRHRRNRRLSCAVEDALSKAGYAPDSTSWEVVDAVGNRVHQHQTPAVIGLGEGCVLYVRRPAGVGA